MEDSHISGDDKSIVGTVAQKESSTVIGNTKDQSNIINPMDVANIESQLDKANWYCCFATYENGIMTCTIPKIDNFNQNQVEYNVDIAINGQQFTGFPMIYRFYEIKIEKMEPTISSIEGGLAIKIYGTGLFDSVTKKARISSILGQRYSDLQYDRNNKAFVLNSNPLHWITNDEDVIKNMSPSDLFEYEFKVDITMNNLDWIPAGLYRYCDPKITRVVYHNFPESESENDRLVFLSTKEYLTEFEKIVLEHVKMPDDKKKRDEIEKKKNEEDNLINNVYKRPYVGLLIYGTFFPNTQTLKVRFQAQNCEIDVFAFYKNQHKIACLVPGKTKDFLFKQYMIYEYMEIFQKRIIYI
jgi:hypothetical protein